MTKANRCWIRGPAKVLVPLGFLLSSVQAEVTFLDGGYAELCALAAERNGETELVPLTGSKLGLTATEICTRAIQGWDSFAPRVAESYNNRGVLFFARSEYERAMADFDAAIAKDPLLAQAHVNRGFTLVALQRWSECILALNQGLELGAVEQAKVYFSRGIAHEELGNVRQAYLDYARASELDPGWNEPRQELARFSIREP